MGRDGCGRAAGARRQNVRHLLDRSHCTQKSWASTMVGGEKTTIKWRKDAGAHLIDRNALSFLRLKRIGGEREYESRTVLDDPHLRLKYLQMPSSSDGYALKTRFRST